MRLRAAVHNAILVLIHQLLVLLADEPRDELLPPRQLRKLPAGRRRKRPQHPVKGIEPALCCGADEDMRLCGRNAGECAQLRLKALD